MRLFFGIKLSSALAEVLSRTQDRLLRSIPAGITPATLAQLHLTLLFLGERPDDELARWETALQSCIQGIIPFEISLLGLNAFPHPKDPRVLWAGIDEPTGALQTAVARLRAVASELGCPVEGREFVPHLTLARNKAAKNAIALRLFIERERLPAHREKVSEITLFQSTPTGAGHLYTELASATLKDTDVVR